jgi:hypothetical protein
MRAISRKPSLGALVLGLSLAGGAPEASALEPRPAAEKPRGAGLSEELVVERLVVKFQEGTRVRLREGRLVVLSAERDAEERALLARRGLDDRRLAEDVAAARSLLERAPRTGGLSRVFEQDEALLAERKHTGEERSGQQLADLSLYVEVSLLPGTSAGRMEELLASLNALQSVEVAYVQPPAQPAMVGFGEVLSGVLAAADISPTTPFYESRQGYLDVAPGGIDARYAWTVAGGRGANVRVVDVEGGWNTAHEDMPALFHMGGTQYSDLGWRNHGTAVLGELVGAPNGYGVTGIAHQAQVGYESIGGQSTASAISRAATAVGQGGVVLIELHAQGPADSTACTCNTSQCNLIAMEYWQANYDAIATATATGVTVVEAAGWTNFGSRVDLHGWGEQVTTLGYGDLFSYGENQDYTATFSGTSSASPIVTGAVANLQGVSIARGKGVLSPRYIRNQLTTTGTPQASDSRRIGPLPDLRRAIQQMPDLSWSQAGPIDGRYCTQLHEASDPHAWNDNYLCSTVDHGFRWSSAGPLSDMRCTQLHEYADPHTWDDNYLCVPTSSPLQLSWSSAGPIAGKLCTQVYEDADPYTWNDNYLCY